MEYSEQSTPSSAWISEGILIASAPVVAYLLTLSYIGGYAGFFQIPTDFISINLSTLFSVAGNIAFVAMLVYGLFLTFFLLWPHTDSPVLKRALHLFPFGALLWIQLIFFGKRLHEWGGTLFVVVLFGMLSFVSPLVGRSKGLSYTEKLREYDRRQSSRPSTVADHLIGSPLGRRLGTVALWAWFSLVASSSAGRFGAMWKQEFLVPASSPDCVVLISYGENMIVAPFDRKTKEVERSFSILKKGEDPKLLLSWEKVGPLQVKTQPSTDSHVRPQSVSPISPVK